MKTMKMTLKALPFIGSQPNRILMCAVILLSCMAMQLHAQFYNEVRVQANDPLEDSFFGGSVALSGDLAVIGASGNSIVTGSVYVFQQNVQGDGWEQIKKITAFDGAPEHNFGSSVSISGDLLIVGADQDTVNGPNSGSAYLYGRHHGGPENWGLIKKIVPSDVDDWDFFGDSVSICGDTALVSAPEFDETSLVTGAVYVYLKDQGGPNNWGLVKKLTASDADDGDYFGRSVVIHKDRVIVGATGNDDLGSSSGAAYLFSRDHGGTDNWGEVKKLLSLDGEAYDYFGQSVSIHNDLVIVGANGDDDLGSYSGSAYIFSRNHGGPDYWGQVKKLLASDGVKYDNFSMYSVCINEEYALVGAYDHDLPINGCGAAYLYARNEGGSDYWGEIRKFSASDATNQMDYGRAIALDEDNILIGAPSDDRPSMIDNCGSAYFYGQPMGSHVSILPKEISVQAYVGDEAPLKTITLCSVGDKDLTISQINITSSEFSLVNLPSLPATVSPGHTLMFDLKYVPNDIGSDNTLLQVTSNDGNEPNLDYPVLGVGMGLAKPGAAYASKEIGHACEVLTIDLNTGSGTVLGGLSQYESIRGLAIDSKGRIFARAGGDLANIDGATGNAYPIVPMGYFKEFAFDGNDVLFGADSYELYTIDMKTGEETLVYNSTQSIGGLAFDPTDGLLYAHGFQYSSNKDDIFTIDLTTGVLTMLGSTGLGDYTMGIAFDGLGNLYGLKHDGTGQYNLISIDKTTGAGTILGPTGFEELKGFDIHQDVSNFSADMTTLSASTGGIVNFVLAAGPDQACAPYQVFGTLSGVEPGTPLCGGGILPINWDGFTMFTYFFSNSIFFPNFYGVLDSSGNSTAQMNTCGSLKPKLAGLTMHFAYAAFTKKPWFVSNPVGVEIVP